MHDLDSIRATQPTANIRPIRTFSRTSLRAVPALTATAASVNRALYRTNTHYGLPKGRYTQPNPLHFHITRYTSIGTHFRPTFINIQEPKNHFSAAGNLRAVINDNVSLKIGNCEPIPLNLSIRSLREFIYPFANVLNLNLVNPSVRSGEGLTRRSSYLSPSSSDGDYVHLTERSCQTSYVAGSKRQFDDSFVSDFEVSIINNMHDTLVNDLSANCGEGLDKKEELVYDYVDCAVDRANSNVRKSLDFDNRGIDNSKSDNNKTVHAMTGFSKFADDLMESESLDFDPNCNLNFAEEPNVDQNDTFDEALELSANIEVVQNYFSNSRRSEFPEDNELEGEANFGSGGAVGVDISYDSQRENEDSLESKNLDVCPEVIVDDLESESAVCDSRLTQEENLHGPNEDLLQSKKLEVCPTVIVVELESEIPLCGSGLTQEQNPQAQSRDLLESKKLEVCPNVIVVELESEVASCSSGLAREEDLRAQSRDLLQSKKLEVCPNVIVGELESEVASCSSGLAREEDLRAQRRDLLEAKRIGAASKICRNDSSAAIECKLAPTFSGYMRKRLVSVQPVHHRIAQLIRLTESNSLRNISAVNSDDESDATGFFVEGNYLDAEIMGENEMEVLLRASFKDVKKSDTIWDESSNGQDYYPTRDLVHLINFGELNICPDFSLRYYTRVLSNISTILTSCTAIDLNETIKDRKYGGQYDDVINSMVLEESNGLKVFRMISEENRTAPKVCVLANNSVEIRTNFVNKMMTWGGRTLKNNITQHVLDIEKFAGTASEKVSALAKRIRNQLEDIELQFKHKFILDSSIYEQSKDAIMNTLDYIQVTKSKMPLVVSNAPQRKFELAYLYETFDFLGRFRVRTRRDLQNLFWDLDDIRKHFAERNLTLSYIDVAVLMSHLNKVGECYQVQLPNCFRDWFFIDFDDFWRFVKPWMSDKQFNAACQDDFVEVFAEAQNWMFNECVVENPNAEAEKTFMIQEIEKPDQFLEEHKSIGEKSHDIELPNDFEFELSELLKHLVEHDEDQKSAEARDDFEGEFLDEPSFIHQDDLEYFKCEETFADINEEYSFSEKNYDTFLKYHQKIIDNLLKPRDKDSFDSSHKARCFNSSDVEIEEGKLLDFELELDLEDFCLSDEGLGNSINATKTVTPKDDSDSVIYYDEATSKLSEMVLTFIKQQSYEIKELVIFPDLLGDVQTQKLLAKLVDLYKNNCSDFSDTQKNELRLNIASYCLNRLEMNDSSDSNTNIVSDKVFSITEFISDILDQFFDLLMANKTRASKKPRKLAPQKTSTPEDALDQEETVTAFHIHKRRSSERFWVSINKSPSLRSSPKVTRPASAKVFNIDDIPLRLPLDLEHFEQFKFVVNDSEDHDLDDSGDDAPFKSRLASFEERVKLDNLFTEMQPDFSLPSSKIVSPLPSILEESNRVLFSEENYNSDSETSIDENQQQQRNLTASNVKVNLLNDTQDSFEKGDYIAFDRPEINVIVSSEVNFYRTNTVNASAFICESNITFTKESPSSSYKSCSDSRSNDPDSSLDVINENDESNQSEASPNEAGNWLGYEKAIF